MPALHPACRFAEHPVADLVDQADLLGDGDEFQRADQAAFRMLPADQRFGLDDAAVARIDDGLEVHLELASPAARCAGP